MNNPQAFNRYAYTLNNPIRYNDPSGHFASLEEVLQSHSVTSGPGLNAGNSFGLTFGFNLSSLNQVGGMLFSQNFSSSSGLSGGFTNGLFGHNGNPQYFGHHSSYFGCNCHPSVTQGGFVPTYWEIFETASYIPFPGNPGPAAKVAAALGGILGSSKFFQKTKNFFSGIFTNKLGSFAGESKLLAHFEKHGAEFGAKSADEYLSTAHQVMQNGNKVKYLYKGETRNGFVQLMGTNRKGQSKFAFVGTNSKGQITTFHTKSGKDFWKTLNGNAKDKTIRPVK